jgi:acetyl/propionyl-CoA carboxylase alpha subunit
MEKLKMKLDVKFENEFHSVDLIRCSGGVNLRIDGKEYPVTLQVNGAQQYRLSLHGREENLWIVHDGDDVFVHAFGKAWSMKLVDPVDFASGSAEDDGNSIEAPMPGTTVIVSVAVGDVVKKGDALLTMESMKLETVISAWRDGIVAQVNVEVGSAFDRGSVLVALEEEA